MSDRSRHPSLVMVLLALMAVLALTAPAGAAARPNPFVGVVSEDAFGAPGAYRGGALDTQAGLGVGTIRQTFDWATIETGPGRYDFDHIDGFVADTARRGIGILPILFNPPAFHSSRPETGALRGTYPPRNPSDFAAFATVMARRYGPGGAFWAEHADVPPLPIRAWQIWNEPNLPVYWRPAPSARGYVRLLRAASDAIKAVDPGAEIVTAGLPQSKLGIPLASYVRQMYRAGGRSAFDTLAVNPYAPTSAGVVAFLRRIRHVMDRRGDRGAGLRATEIGWSTTRPDGRFSVGHASQALTLATTVRRLWAQRRSLRLRGFIYFNWRDAPPYPGGKDFWGLHTGLLEQDGRPKPALAAFRTAIASLR